MNNFGKRSMGGTMEQRSSGTCFAGCLVTCCGMCKCTGKKAANTADSMNGDGGKSTTVWGRNYVNLSGD